MKKRGCCTILVIHRNAFRRREATEALRAHGLPCCDAATWRAWADAHGPASGTASATATQPAALLPLDLSDPRALVERVTRIAEQLPESAAIALMPFGDQGTAVAPEVSIDPAAETARPSAQGVTTWVTRLRRQVREACTESSRALVAAVEAKDPYTRSHSQKVAKLAEAIGLRMHLAPRMLEALHVAALLHDVGKIGVPDAILTKPGSLTDAEFDIVKRHPRTALVILEPVRYLTDEKPMILHHHERYDGTGYPDGLAGERIPIGARILAVADAVDTMLSPRSYKAPFKMGKVIDELQTNRGRQFDPTVVDVALQCLDEQAVSVLATA